MIGFQNSVSCHMSVSISKVFKGMMVPVINAICSFIGQDSTEPTNGDRAANSCCTSLISITAHYGNMSPTYKVANF